jgi:hypothetical protein
VRGLEAFSRLAAWVSNTGVCRSAERILIFYSQWSVRLWDIIRLVAFLAMVYFFVFLLLLHSNIVPDD